MPRFERVHARQILDSRGNPTVEVEVELSGGHSARAAVPSGASTGSHEAVELRDGGATWGGKGVSAAVANVNGEVAQHLVGKDFADLRSIDETLCALDGTPNKGRLGANAILGVSLASARALAQEEGSELWKWVLNQTPDAKECTLPVPMLNIINGGEHANNGLDIQEFMVIPHGFSSYSKGLEAAVSVFHKLKSLINDQGMSTAVGDEGGFAPNIGSNREALLFIVDAIKACGFEPGAQMSIALDVAATELYDPASETYRFDGQQLTRGQVIVMYRDFIEISPLISIEDGMSEDDWTGWSELTAALGSETQLVGDDLFVTNIERIQRGIDGGVGNALLVKVNQIGSLTETLDAIRLARSAGMRIIMSHRSGETEDPIIADLAVGTASGQIKTGAPSRSDRVAKYNQLLRIEEALVADGADAGSVYAKPFAAGVAAGSIR